MARLRHPLNLKADFLHHLQPSVDRILFSGKSPNHFSGFSSLLLYPRLKIATFLPFAMSSLVKRSTTGVLPVPPHGQISHHNDKAIQGFIFKENLISIEK